MNDAQKPQGLGQAGSALWDLIQSALGEVDPEGGGREMELTEREVAYLTLACRQADDVAALESEVESAGLTTVGSTGQTVLHPALAEIRQGRVAIERYLSKLSLPEGGERPLTEAGKRAQHAANARWQRERDKWGGNGAA